MRDIKISERVDQVLDGDVFIFTITIEINDGCLEYIKQYFQLILPIYSPVASTAKKYS
jgi:hypothetical protein